MDLQALSTQEVLDRISRHCPESLSVYLICLNHAKSDGQFFFTKQHVQNNLYYSWTKFKGHLRKLALENVLMWAVLDGGIAVTIADCEDE